ncbi:MAG: dihydrofolate reductase family protein [Alphaproteobacteria bacterium]|nr:dihydrofolate reductase family protein [Alphaproteobacteria bacterium]
MTTGHVFMAMSIDGFVARQDHRLDWLMKQKTEGEDHGYDEFMASVDGLIMGSGSFRNVLTFGDWPYRKPVIVMSRSLTTGDIPLDVRDKVSITPLDPGGVMASLAKKGWRRAYVDGGLVVQSFLRAGLVGDMTITLIPILIGSGRRLFGQLDRDIDLELLASKSFPSGLVQTRYRIRQEQQQG